MRRLPFVFQVPWVFVREHALDVLHTHLGAGLANDLAQQFAHFSSQDRVAVLGDPDDVKPVVGFGWAASIMGHNIPSGI